MLTRLITLLAFAAGLAAVRPAVAGAEFIDGDLDSESGLLVGDPASGQQAGDRVLAAGEVDDLTLRVELPLETRNSVQDAESTATFTFGSDAGAGDDDDETGSPSVATGDSGLRGAPATNKANPVDPRIPMGVFAAGLTVLIAYAQRSTSVEVKGAVKEPAKPADSP